MVWANTSEIGCTKVLGTTSYGKEYIYGCNYYPPGLIMDISKNPPEPWLPYEIVNYKHGIFWQMFNIYMNLFLIVKWSFRSHFARIHGIGSVNLSRNCIPRFEFRLNFTVF